MSLRDLPKHNLLMVQLMSNKIFIKNVKIEGASVDGDFHYYNGIIQSKSLNTRHFFHASDETLRSIEEQANAGVHIRDGHSYYTKPLGRSVSASMVDGKVNSTFFIQAGINDTNSDDHIKRLDSGIIDMLSTGLMLTDESKMICDICGEEMTLKYSWFSSYFEDDEGHILGQKLRDGTRVTAELRGPVKLEEYSIVASGADPDAEILKKVSENLESGVFDNATLAYFAESHGWELQSFVSSLESDAGKKYHLGGINMDPEKQEQLESELAEANAEVDRLQSEVEALSGAVAGTDGNPHPEQSRKEIERLQSELADAESERDKVQSEKDALEKRIESMVEKSEHDKLQSEKDALDEQVAEMVSAEDFAELETEKTELTSRAEQAENDLAEEKKVSAEIATLRTTLVSRYKGLYLHLYYNGEESEHADTESERQVGEMSVTQIYNSVCEMQRSLAKKRTKSGRKSRAEEVTRKSGSRVPKHLNELN